MRKHFKNYAEIKTEQTNGLKAKRPWLQRLRPFFLKKDGGFATKTVTSFDWFFFFFSETSIQSLKFGPPNQFGPIDQLIYPQNYNIWIFIIKTTTLY